MIKITYVAMVLVISLIWILNRVIVGMKKKQWNWKRELQLVLVYICLIVVARFVFFPFGKVDGEIQPLIFDINKIYPFRINPVPLVYLLDYVIAGEAMLNVIGNITMFIPIGIVWPIVYKELNTPAKAIAAGIGFSLSIEVVQLLFYDRVTDADDLILNSLGYVIGYGVYWLVKKT